jgi:hypothetical protein
METHIGIRECRHIYLEEPGGALLYGESPADLILPGIPTPDPYLI